MQQYTDKLKDRYVDQPIKWATLAGFVLMIIGVFGPWATIDLGIIQAETHGSDHNGTLILILAVVGLAAILAYVFANLNFDQMTLLWALVIITVIIDVLVLLDFLDIAGEDGVGMGWGLWLTLIGAILATVGAVLPMWGNIRSKAEGMRR